MMYRHEIFNTADASFMRHYRQSTRPSGLVAMTEIGQTVLKEHLTDLFPNRPNGLLIAANPGNLTIPTVPNESIASTDLEHFVQDGITSWQRLIGVVGERILHIEVFHEELPERVDPNALILPYSLREEPERFRGYVANPAEIEALDALAERTNVLISPNGEMPGQYL